MILQCQFSPLWCNEYPHLEHSLIKDAAFCFICTLFPNGSHRNYFDSVWSEKGVHAWHKMKGRGIKKPENKQLMMNIKTNLTILFDITRMLSRQGLAFRGDGSEENEVKEADIYSVMADTTPVISHRDQLSVYVRYVKAAGEISERLLEIIETSNKTGLGIAETIESVIVNNELPPKNVVFQSYDFPSSMSGKINGTQQKLSELLGHTVFTKRYVHLQKSLAEIENSLQLSNLSKTRWTARADSIKAVWVSFDSIIKILEEMSTAQYFDKNTRYQVLGIVKKILTYDFVVLLYFMKNVMYKMKILTEMFEAKDLNIIDALMLLNSSTDIFNDINNDSIGMDNLIDSSINYAHQLNISPKSELTKYIGEDYCQKVPIIKYAAEDFKKIINIFPPRCSVSNIKDFYAVYSECLVLVHRCKDAKNVLDILNVSEMYKHILPNMNKILRLMFTAPGAQEEMVPFETS
ncbi:52 kDa repressor of the inhibitor of the protein kinase-like [Aphis craccivora]|uniref:52 kDa repressor of the inhibitor of the protein kinase-like n=1 Tax=Aphis craccivora TaxID=307492 RepID=A0A6G0Y4L9_APHCR|nr:52 kDa repressor of the inhibitor of the protein kinase-like [Aphis craccivora]